MMFHERLLKMEKKDKVDLIKAVAVGTAIVTVIAVAGSCSERDREKFQAELKAERLYCSAESGFKTMLGYGEDDTGLKVTNTDFGNHTYSVYVDTEGYIHVELVKVCGVTDTEIVMVQYFEFKTGSDYYAVSNLNCNEESNGIGITRTLGDSTVKFDSSKVSVESVNTFAVYDTVTKELYIPKNN